MNRYRAVSLLGAVLLAAILAAQQAATFEVAGMSCGNCVLTAAKALRGISGVTHAVVDFETKRASVTANREVSKAEFRVALAQYGFEARFADDPPAQRISSDERAKLDIKVASRGEEFDLRRHLAAGKVTIFDFWAEWCGPCHVLTPKLELLVRDNPRVALRTIDLKQWESPAGRQVTKDFKVPALPYVRVYAADGRFVGEVLGNDIEKIKQLVAAGQ